MVATTLGELFSQQELDDIYDYCTEHRVTLKEAIHAVVMDAVAA